MSLPELLLYGQAGASVVMFLGWLVALKIRHTSYVDVLWAYGVGILGIVYLYLLREDCHPARYALLLGLLGVWSARLGTHLLRRCWGKPEDARYLYLREYLGEKANLGFFLFFQVQAFWVVLFASPFLILASNPSDLLWTDQLGMFIWIVGFVGVSLADKQLRLFKNSPTVRGRKSAIPDCGNIPAIPIIFLSGSYGWATCPWVFIPLVVNGSFSSHPSFTSFLPRLPGFLLWRHESCKPVGVPIKSIYNLLPPFSHGFPNNFFF